MAVDRQLRSFPPADFAVRYSARWARYSLAAMEIPEPAGPPYIDPDREDPKRPVCGICPATLYPREQFVVYNRPSWECPFHPENGHRYTHDETVPACVHPDKIGLEPDRIAPPPKATPDPDEAPRRRRGWRLPWNARLAQRRPPS